MSLPNIGDIARELTLTQATEVLARVIINETVDGVVARYGPEKLSLGTPIESIRQQIFEFAVTDLTTRASPQALEMIRAAVLELTKDTFYRAADDLNGRIVELIAVDWAVPTLKVDTPQIRGSGGMPFHPRQRVERRVVWNLLHYLAANGYEMTHVVATDELPVFCATPLEVMEEIFDLDEGYLMTGPDESEAHWVKLSFGGDGWDCMPDWSYPGYEDAQGKRFDAVMAAFNPKDCC